MTTEELQRILANINGINLNEESAFERIEKVILQDINLPIITYDKLPIGAIIYRSREHKENEGDFMHMRDLMAREDVDNIEDYGRANKPHQSIFYGGDDVSTTISEVSRIARGEHYKEIDEVFITSVCYEIIQKLNLAVVSHHKNAYDQMEFTRYQKIYIDKLVKEQYPDDAELIFKVLEKFSDSFAVNTYGNPNLYKVSCAYAQTAYKIADGVLYPSLQREFKGINFALNPDISKKCLKPIRAQKDRLIKISAMKFHHYSTKFSKFISADGQITWGEEELT